MPEENTGKISESDELLQDTIDALNGYIAILDNRGNILKINRAWSSLAGHDSKNYSVGSNYIDACRELSSEPVAAQLADGIIDVINQNRKAFEIEYPYQNPNESRWYVTRVVPVGEVENRRIIVTHENITARKFVERALRESEESYRILAQTASDVIIKIDSDSNVIFINSASERVFGYKPEEVIGRSLTMLIPEHLRENHRSGIGRYLQTGKQNLSWQSLELPALHKDGHIFPLEISFGEFKQDEKHYFIGVARDVSERKQTEKATAYLAAIVKSSDDAIISKDLNGIITSWNKSAERVFGYTAEEMTGKPVLTLIPPHLQSEEQVILSRIRSGAAIEHFETVRRRKDGTDITVSLTVSPIQDEAGKIIGASKIVRDITEKIVQEEMLRQNQLMLSLAMQSSRMGAWERDVSTETVIWSEELEEIFGLPPGSFGQTLDAFNNLVHKDDREQVLYEVEKAVAEYRDYSIEFRFYHADGSIRWMEGRGQAVYSDEGKPVRLYGIGIDITERKKAEEIIRRSAKQLALVTDIAPVYIAHCDADKRFKFVNKAYAERFALQSRDCVGKRISDILGAEAYRMISPYVELVLSGQAVEFEMEIPFQSIGTRFMHCSYAPEFDESGEVAGWVAAVTDISERRKIEDALRRAAEFDEAVLTNMGEGLYTVDAQGLVTTMNPAAEKLFGWTFEELRGRGIHDATHYKRPDGSDFPAEECASYQVLRNGEPVASFEDVFVRRDGTFFNVIYSSAPIRENGEVTGLVVVFRDITERKQAQEALLAAERKAAEDYQALLSRIVPLAQTFGTAGNLLTIYREVGNFIRASMPCSAFFISFYDAEKSLRIAAYVCGEEGEVDVSALPPMKLTEDGGPNSQAIFGKKSVVANRYMDLMKNRPHVILQEDGRDPNSSLVVPMKVMNRVLGTLEVQAYEDNAFTNEHIIALEMVANLAAVAIENVRLLEVEAKARQEAEAANRAKDEFLSVLSHELRTPLNAILGWTRMLKSGILDAPRTNQAIETIERNARLQNNLIEDLLDVSRIISGKMLIEKEEVDIVSIVKSAVETANPAAQEKNIALSFQSDFISKNLTGDATRLQQVVNNLLNNAVKFTPASGYISVTLKQKAGKIQIKVKDSGIGISADFLPLIFDRFRQADSTTRRSHSGLGLGLTIVRHLTELHGGTIEVTSAGENLGSTFIIELPISDDSAETFSAFDDFLRTQNPSKIKGARILLVDDDREGVQPLQILLETQQAEVHYAASASDALEKISEHQFDVMVSDIGMPEMDGYQLINEARRLTDGKYFLPAIAVTAYASSQDRERALSAGFQNHMSKPIDFEQFINAINNLLNNRG